MRILNSTQYDAIHYRAKQADDIPAAKEAFRWLLLNDELTVDTARYVAQFNTGDDVREAMSWLVLRGSRETIFFNSMLLQTKNLDASRCALEWLIELNTLTPAIAEMVIQADRDKQECVSLFKWLKYKNAMKINLAKYLVKNSSYKEVAFQALLWLVENNGMSEFMAHYLAINAYDSIHAEFSMLYLISTNRYDKKRAKDLLTHPKVCGKVRKLAFDWIVDSDEKELQMISHYDTTREIFRLITSWVGDLTKKTKEHYDSDKHT